MRWSFSLLFLVLASSQSAFAAKVNGLGKDYEVYDFGTYSDNVPWYQDFAHPTNPPNNNWYVPAHQYKNPVYLYQLNPNLVKSQMQNMRTSGVDVLVLHITAGELAACEASGACPTPYNDGIWGYATDDSGYALRTQQQTNLQAIVQYAASIGFRKVFLRFDYSDVGSWTSWNETEYQHMWNLIVSTRNIAAAALANTATHLLIDLGGEQIGLSCTGSCQTQAYVTRLWTDYFASWGTADTVGFSFIGCAWVVTNGLPWYGTAKPTQYAFDNYGGCSTGSSIQTDLTAAWQALGSEKSKPIMIMETFDNDSTTASNVSAMLAANPSMNLTDVVQWPLTRTPSCPGCDGNIQNAPIAALATTTQVSNYLSIAANAATENLIPSLLNIDGSSCVSGSSSTCAKINVGYAPSGGNNNWQIWVTLNNGTRSAMACNAGTAQITVPWMLVGYAYRFDYYKTNSCSATPPLGSQSATSYITFR